MADQRLEEVVISLDSSHITGCSIIFVGNLMSFDLPRYYKIQIFKDCIHWVIFNCTKYTVYSMRLSDAYTGQKPNPSLVQIMACFLFCAKPLSQRMMENCKLNPWEQTSVKSYAKFVYFLSRQDVFENNVCETAAKVSWPDWVYHEIRVVIRNRLRSNGTSIPYIGTMWHSSLVTCTPS